MASSEYEHIRFEVEPNGVAFLTFNLPKMANAMDLLGVQETLDGKLDVTVRYRDPRRDSGFDPELLKLTVPQGVRIQDFR